MGLQQLLQANTSVIYEQKIDHTLPDQKLLYLVSNSSQLQSATEK